MTRFLRVGLKAAAIPVLLLVSSSGCEQAGSAPVSTPDAPVKVEVASPLEKEITDFHEFTGRLDAVESVEVRARVSGYLTKIEFDPDIGMGAEVQAGDLLFEIDTRPFQNALESAEAQLAAASARLTVATAELARTEELFKKNVAPQAELDLNTGNKLMAEAAIKSGKAAVAQAKLDLEFARITAPISGRISEPALTVGNLVTQSTGALTSIVSVNPVYLYFDMDEPTLLVLQKLMREGQLQSVKDTEVPLLLGLATDEDYPYQGRLDFVENKVDSNTGTIRVRGVFANPKSERGQRPLSPGLFARVRLPLGEAHKAVLIPERAIGRNQGQSFVYVVDADNEVVYRRVKLGALHDGLRVVADGLTVKERIVTNGLQRVRPGVKVEWSGGGDRGTQ